MEENAISPSLQLAWALASREACLAGCERIEPPHFLMALLTLCEPGFLEEAAALDISGEEVEEVRRTSSELLSVLGFSADQARLARRKLRRTLRQGAVPLDLADLHRSERSKRLFAAAAGIARLENTRLSAVHLMRAIILDPPPEAGSLLRAPREGTPEHAGQPHPGGPTPVDADGREPPPVDGRKPFRKGGVLARLGRDITRLAAEGRLPPVVGRKEEIKTMARYLQRTSKANVLLIGEAGVGKTALVEGLAQRLADPQAPDFLRCLHIVQINVADLVAGTNLRGQMEERLQDLVDEVSSDPDLILFLDEVHLVAGAGSGGGAMDVANILKPALAREGFHCIGATTAEEFERHLRKDGALLRRFQILHVPEPSPEDALAILHSWAKRIERAQNVAFGEGALEAAVYLSDRWIKDRHLPDKALDLLENAAAAVKVDTLTYQDAAGGQEMRAVTVKDVVAALEELTGVPIGEAEDRFDRDALVAALSERVLGQEEAVAAVAESLAANALRGDGCTKPLGVFLFTGPTGTGKTHAAEALFQCLYEGRGGGLGRFNMSEFKERHEIARLIGAPPGYVGHEQAGALFRFLQQWPQGVILLDEMEKAHPEVQDYFLQIFDKAEAMDPSGRRHDFRHYVFIMTCNILMAPARRGRPIGFSKGEGGQEPGEAGEEPTPVKDLLAKVFRREFLARLDACIPFQPLTMGALAALAADRLARLYRDLGIRGGLAEVPVENLEALAAECLKSGEGGRGLIGLIDRDLAPKLRRAAGPDGIPPERVVWDQKERTFRLVFS